jgi:hypothetical protein
MVIYILGQAIEFCMDAATRGNRCICRERKSGQGMMNYTSLCLLDADKNRLDAPHIPPTAEIDITLVQ